MSKITVLLIDIKKKLKYNFDPYIFLKKYEILFLSPNLPFLKCW
jgi:hypothetical protein